MSRNSHSRHCRVDGCRAWPMHGQSLCSSHMRSRAVRERSGLIMPLLLALESTHDGPHTDIELIDEELDRLREGRRYFRRWVEEFRAQDPAERRGLSPWAFLRAWNDSTARIVQLLEQRRALSGETHGGFEELVESVRDDLEKSAALAYSEAASGPGSKESQGEATADLRGARDSSALGLGMTQKGLASE